MKLLNLLHENYGGPGELELPDSHQAGMRVTKGGSMCANCEYWNYDDSKDSAFCSNKYWNKWSQAEGVIPYPADEYCCDWWEPAPKEKDAED